MLEQWETFYLMVGSSSAALIGLMFVVVTLNADSKTPGREVGSRLFVTPIVFHFSMVFLISTLPLMPDVSPPIMAAGVLAVGVVGLAFVAWTLARLVFGGLPVPHWSDYVFYGVLPLVLYGALAVCGIGLFAGAAFAVHALAVSVLALLFLGIRDAWDLATWLAYHRDGA
jgi:hypothetical protein